MKGNLSILANTRKMAVRYSIPIRKLARSSLCYPISSTIKLGAFQNCLDKSEASRSSIILLEANLPLEATMCILTKTIAKL